jgi:hypothetical protein
MITARDEITKLLDQHLIEFSIINLQAYLVRQLSSKRNLEK